MRFLLVSMLAITLGAGCTAYPRYRSHGAVTPRRVADQTALTTRDYVRLGLILQRQLGKPYKGRSKWEEGLDCSKFTSGVYKEYDGTQLARTVAGQFQEGKEITRRRLKYGDLVFFRIERDRVSHVGLYTGHDEFIHASTSRGVIISNLREKYWARRYAGARRVLKTTSK